MLLSAAHLVQTLCAACGCVVCYSRLLITGLALDAVLPDTPLHNRIPGVEPPLPPGWTMHRKQGGQSYYYNAQTKASTYDRPGTEVAEVAKPLKKKPISRVKVEGTTWFVVWWAGGKQSYFNAATKKSQYKLPEELVGKDLPEQPEVQAPPPAELQSPEDHADAVAMLTTSVGATDESAGLAGGKRAAEAEPPAAEKRARVDDGSSGVPTALIPAVAVPGAAASADTSADAEVDAGIQSDAATAADTAADTTATVAATTAVVGEGEVEMIHGIVVKEIHGDDGEDDEDDGDSAAPTGVLPQSKRTFIHAAVWRGSKRGFVFKKGVMGNGYYLDRKPVTCPKLEAEIAEIVAQRAKSKALGGGDGGGGATLPEAGVGEHDEPDNAEEEDMEAALAAALAEEAELEEQEAEELAQAQAVIAAAEAEEAATANGGSGGAAVGVPAVGGGGGVHGYSGVVGGGMVVPALPVMPMMPVQPRRGLPLPPQPPFLRRAAPAVPKPPSFEQRSAPFYAMLKEMKLTAFVLWDDVKDTFEESTDRQCRSFVTAFPPITRAISVVCCESSAASSALVAKYACADLPCREMPRATCHTQKKRERYHMDVNQACQQQHGCLLTFARVRLGVNKEHQQ
jgi:hypothetical protein